MALLAEEIVEEWLNRQCYFTIRGARLGRQEIDILAVRQKDDGKVDCRHIEVQASMRPVSYISRLPKRLQNKGRAANTPSRTKDEVAEGVAEWVHNKFRKEKKLDLMRRLWKGEWSSELVLNVVKSHDEVRLIEAQGVKVLRLNEVCSALERGNTIIKGASNADFVDLIQMRTGMRRAMTGSSPSSAMPGLRDQRATTFEERRIK